MKKLFLLHLLFLSLLLPAAKGQDWWDPYNDQVRPGFSHHGSTGNLHFIRYEPGECPRHLYMAYFPASDYFNADVYDCNPYAQLQISFNNGVDWEPLERYAEVKPYTRIPVILGTPPNTRTCFYLMADVTSLVQSHARFWVRAFVLNDMLRPHFISYSMEFERRACQDLIKYRGSFVVQADQSTIDVPDLRASFRIKNTYQYNTYFPPVSHWEVAERRPNEPDFNWQRISTAEREIELGPFVHRDTDYEIAVRPVFESCPQMEQYSDTAYITVKARPALSVRVIAGQDSACPNDALSFELSDPATSPLYWLVNRELDPREDGLYVLTSPQQVNGQDSAAANGFRLDLPLNVSPLTLTHRFWRRFESAHGQSPRVTARAVFRDAEGFLVATSAAETPLRRFAAGGYVSENHVLCTDGFLPAPLTLQHAQGVSAAWESSADSLIWTPLGETGWSFDPPQENSDRWYRALVTGGCSDVAASEPARITVVPSTLSGQLETVYGEAVVCFDAPTPAIRLQGYAGNIIGWKFTRLTDDSQLELPYRSPLVGLPERADMDVRAVVEATGCPRIETPPLSIRLEQGGAPTHKPAESFPSQRVYCIDDRVAVQLRMEIQEDVEPLYWEYLASDNLDALLQIVQGQHQNHPDATWHRIETAHIETTTVGNKMIFTAPYFHPAIVNPNAHPTTACYVVRGVFRRRAFPDCRPFTTNPSIVQLPTCVDPECRVTAGATTACRGDSLSFTVLNTPVFDSRTVIEVSLSSDFDDIISEFDYHGVPLTLEMTQTACYRARIELGTATFYSLSVCVTVVDGPQPGRLEADDLPICIGETSAAIEVVDYFGSVLDWQLSPDGDNWESRFNTANVTHYRTPPLFQDTWVRARITACNQTAETAPVLVRVRRDETPVGGAASLSRQVVCAGNPVQLQLTGHQGQIRYWLRSSDNWATSERISTSSSTFNVFPQAGRISYRAMVSNGLCTDLVASEPASVEAKVTESGQEGKVIAMPSTVCPDRPVLLQLEDATGEVVRWEYSINDWRTVRETFDVQQTQLVVIGANETRWYRAVVRADECRLNHSASVRLTSKPAPVPQNVTPSPVKACPGELIELEYGLQHAVSGRWEASLDEGETWTALVNADSLESNLAFTPESSLWIRRVALDSCHKEHVMNGTIKIERQPDPGPVQGGRVAADHTEWCPNEQAMLRLEDHQGEVAYWLRSSDHWATAETLDVRVPEYNAGVIRQSVAYRAIVSSPLCSIGEETQASAPMLLKPADVPAFEYNGRVESASYTVCRQGTAALSLVDYQGQVTHWESSTSNWQRSTKIIAEAPVVEVSLDDNRSTRYRAYVSYNRCYSLFSKDIQLEPVKLPYPSPNPPSSVQACANVDFSLEYTVLHAVSARWELSYDRGATWTSLEGSDASASQATLNLTRSAYLRRVAIDSCGTERPMSSVVQINLVNTAVGAISGPSEVCHDIYASYIFSTTRPNAESAMPAWYWRRAGGEWKREAQWTYITLYNLEAGRYELQLRTEVVGCLAESSAVHEMLIHSLGSPAKIVGDALVCSGQSFNLAAVDYEGEVLRWEMKSDRCNTNQQWTQIPQSGSRLSAAPMANDEIRCYRAVTRKLAECAEVPGRLFEVKANPPRMVFIQGGVGEDCWQLGRTPLSLVDLPVQTRLNWQYSYDQVQWTDLFNHTETTLSPPLRHPAVWYRAWIETSTCGEYPSLPFLARIDTSKTEKPEAISALPCENKPPTLRVRTSSRDFRWIVRIGNQTLQFSNQHEVTFSPQDWGSSSNLNAWVEYRCGSGWERTESVSLSRGPVSSPAQPLTSSSSYCGTDLPLVISLPSSETGSVLRWESSDDNFQQSIQTYEVTSRGLRLDPPPARSLTYRAVMQGPSCFELPTKTVEVRYDAPPVGGQLAASPSKVCQGETTVLRLTGHEGRVACWLRQSEEEAEPETLFVQTDTLRVAAPERRTSYWAVIANGGCQPAVSEPVAVEAIEFLSVEGEIEASANALCPGQSATLNWAGHGQVLYWESISDGQQAPVRIDSQSPTMEIGPLNRSTIYRVSLQAEGCQGIAERSIRITAVPAPAVETLLPAAIYSCPGISELVSYRVRHAQYARWEFKAEPDGDWQPLSEGDLFADASDLVLRQSGWLRRVALDSCGVEHGLTAIQVIASPVVAPILDGPTALCGEHGATLFVTSEHGAGASFRWQRRQEGASWMDVNATGTELTLTGLQPGEYFFRVASRAGNCQSEFSAVHAVVVVPAVQPPALSASLICAGLALEAQAETYVAGFRFKVMSETGAEATYPGQDVLRLSTADFADAEWLDVWIEYPCGTEFRSTEARRALLYKPATYSTLASVQRVCPGSNRFELSLSGPAPGLRRWESSKDGFQTVSQRWFTERTTWTVAGMTETTSFRAVYMDETCGELAAQPIEVQADPSVCEPQQVCPTPQGVWIQTLSSTQAVAHWTAPAQARRVIVEIKPNTPAATQWISFTALEPEQMQLLLDNLRPGTEYVARMKSRCQSSGESEYTQSFTFRTPMSRLESVGTTLNGVRAYPNPVRQWLTVELPATGCSWSVLNLAGQHLMQGSTDGDRLSLQMERLPAGMYLLRIDVDGRMTTLRLSKVE